MNPTAALALLDAALTIAERAPAILAEMLAKGEITAAQQQERMDRVKAVQTLTGHVSPPGP